MIIEDFLLYSPKPSDTIQQLLQPDFGSELVAGTLDSIFEKIAISLERFILTDSLSIEGAFMRFSVGEYDLYECASAVAALAGSTGLWAAISSQSLVLSAGDADGCYSIRTNDWYIPAATKRGLQSWLQLIVRTSHEVRKTDQEAVVPDFLVVESTAVQQCYIQTFPLTTGGFVVECRLGSAEKHFSTEVDSVEAVEATIVAWMQDQELPDGDWERLTDI